MKLLDPPLRLFNRRYCHNRRASAGLRLLVKRDSFTNFKILRAGMSCGPHSASKTESRSLSGTWAKDSFLFADHRSSDSSNRSRSCWLRKIFQEVAQVRRQLCTKSLQPKWIFCSMSSLTIMVMRLLRLTGQPKEATQKTAELM